MRAETTCIFTCGTYCIYRTDAANDDKAVMEFMKTASAEDILKKTEFWGEDLSFLLPTVQKHLDEIEKNGIRKAMEKVVD